MNDALNRPTTTPLFLGRTLTGDVVICQIAVVLIFNVILVGLGYMVLYALIVYIR